MASLARAYSREKLLGQVFTPAFIVQKILDDVGFDSTKVLGKKILDPACGDGRFLVEIARRIIEKSPKESLCHHLACVHGWDIDPEAVRLCRRNLDDLAAAHGVSVDWNVGVADALRHKAKPSSVAPDKPPETFDFIVGNPPYIRIQHLSAEQRAYIQEHFQFCRSGSTDIFIAFFELSLSLLSSDGMLGFITPNSYIFTETARHLRQHLVSSGSIVQISNYGDLQVFDNATTYSAITILSRRRHEQFLFQKASSLHKFECREIRTDSLASKSWQLSTRSVDFQGAIRLGDIASIHVGVTTLCDKAYIVSIVDEEGECVMVNSRLRGLVALEKSILKPIVKASRLKTSEQKIKEYIIFPYRKISGKHQIIPEADLAAQFPRAMDYLLSVKEELDKRDAGKPNPVAWYAFGRSQGLDTSFGSKILFSPMNNRPNFVYFADEESTFYSGYCIKYDGDRSNLLNQLNSPDMEAFVASSSRDFRGGWKAYNKKIIENFLVNA